MKLLKFDDIKNTFSGKKVAIFGSAPNCLENDGKEIDKHDYVIRVNNFKIFPEKTGKRIDVHYSFYGSSIRTTKESIKDIKFHMCKCPNDFCFDHNVPWDPHNRGSDFRWIYENRKDFWLAPVYIPTKERFMKYFDYLGGHVPTTGFSCILDLIDCEPQELYITGFDGFKSGLHNINERWRDKSKVRNDPISHIPEKETKLLKIFKEKHAFIRSNCV